HTATSLLLARRDILEVCVCAKEITSIQLVDRDNMLLEVKLHGSWFFVVVMGAKIAHIMQLRTYHTMASRRKIKKIKHYSVYRLVSCSDINHEAHSSLARRLKKKVGMA
ncbi:hypothetical protein ACJX0J_025468, partial [Zea mays]